VGLAAAVFGGSAAIAKPAVSVSRFKNVSGRAANPV